MNRTFKLKKDTHKSKDWLFKHIINNVNPHLNWFWNSSSEVVDLRPYDSPVKDQGHLGSCTANAFASAVEFLELQEMKAKEQGNEVFSLDTFEQLSRLYIYWNERTIEGTTAEDAGAMLRDGCTALAEKGVCRESVWPYDVSKAFTTPSDEAYAEGAKHQMHFYYRINNLDEAKTCLRAGYPFVLGITVFEGLMKIGKDAICPMPKWCEQPLGGHALICMGFDDVKNCLIIKNSWGENFGDKGYFYLPYKYFSNSHLTSDCWTIRRSK